MIEPHLDEAPRRINATYYGFEIKFRDARGKLVPPYATEGRAWREKCLDSFPTERWFFMPKNIAREDDNIFIVHRDSLKVYE